MHSKRSMVSVDCLGRLGEPFIHLLLEGEQLLDARALQHSLKKGIWGLGIAYLIFTPPSLAESRTKMLHAFALIAVNQAYPPIA